MSRRASLKRRTTGGSKGLALQLDDEADDQSFKEEMKNEKESDKRRKVDTHAASALSQHADDAASASSSSSSAAAAAAAASSSSSSAAAAVGSSVSSIRQLAPAAAASSSSSAAAASVSIGSAPDDLVCCVCKESFDSDDSSPLLPRMLPCNGHHQLCTACIIKSIDDDDRVHCPLCNCKFKIPHEGIAAAGLPTNKKEWARLLRPVPDLILSLKHQQHLMTRLGQQGTRCARSGCAAVVTHFCPASECGDLCDDHQRKRHSLAAFKQHNPMLIGLKESWMQQQQQQQLVAPAATERKRVEAKLKLQIQQTQSFVDKEKTLQAQLSNIKIQREASEKKLAAIQRIAVQMRAADDATVLDLAAELLEADPAAIADAAALDSTVLTSARVEQFAALQKFLGEGRPLSKAKLLYRASRDGFKSDDWWSKCGGTRNLLTIVNVKDNGYVFGAFTAFQWLPSAPSSFGVAHLSDPSRLTFLFSLVNRHQRAVKMTLKSDKLDRAGFVFANWGPGIGSDVGLMWCGNSANDSNGNSVSPKCFEFDSVADGGEPIEYEKNLLAGDDGRGLWNEVSFAAEEMESWQL